MLSYNNTKRMNITSKAMNNILRSALNMETLRLKTRYWAAPAKRGSSSAPPRSEESVNMTDVYWDNRADVEAGRGYNNNRDEVRGQGDSGHGSYRDLGEAEGGREKEGERVYAD